ncbi:hypothetical protein [Kitasatospora herbaricolor]|uniref:hypothetical protein n=1 Tax=Kitasatospora herbaricolor TaxID=68217 RepID=UPI0036D842A8
MIALATSAGSAVAQAAGTDAWNGFRARVARLFGRGSAEEVPSGVVLERLDRTAAEVTNPEPGRAGEVRDRAAQAWQTRFQDLLEDADGAGRDALAAGLRELVAFARQAGEGVSAADGGIAVGGDLHVEARDSSAAAVRMGDVTIGVPVNPPTPGPAQG